MSNLKALVHLQSNDKVLSIKFPKPNFTVFDNASDLAWVTTSVTHEITLLFDVKEMDQNKTWKGLSARTQEKTRSFSHSIGIIANIRAANVRKSSTPPS
jgi:hypothetical protein